MWIDEDNIKEMPKGEPGPLMVRKHDRLNMYESVSEILDRRDSSVFYRHRYYVSGNNMNHFPMVQDYTRKQFKNFRLFKRFIQDKEPEDMQVLPSGTYRSK